MLRQVLENDLSYLESRGLLPTFPAQPPPPPPVLYCFTPEQMELLGELCAA